MKKLVIVVSLLMLCSVSASAKEPKKMIRMNIDSGSEFYRSAKYELQSASTYSIWVEEQYTNKSRTRINGAAFTATRYLIDCRNDQFRISTKLHINSEGKFMGGGSMPHTQFATINSGTVESSLFQLICLS